MTRSTSRFASSLTPLWQKLARAAATALPASLLVAGAALVTLAPQAARADETAICYNCPPEWADWASQIKAIQIGRAHV